MKSRIVISILLATIISCGIPEDKYIELKNQYDKLVSENNKTIFELEECINGEERTIALIESSYKEKNYKSTKEHIANLKTNHPQSIKNKDYEILLKKIEKLELKEQKKIDAEAKERIKINKNTKKSKNKIKPLVQSYTFILTHLGSRKLDQKAYFYAGDTSPWYLDLRDGKSNFKYTITGRVGNDPMCGITAKDNLGKSLAICITKMHGDAVEIELRYMDKILSFKGYFKR